MEFLKKLGIEKENYGASTGLKWYGSKKNDVLKIYSPINGKFLAKVETFLCKNLLVRL